MTETAEGQQRELLSLRGINKSFGAVHVLRDVDFDVRPGEVTALVGDNGAGKSTLIKCVAGIHPFDYGEMVFEGSPVTIHGPKDANALGIEIVYQDLALCDNLDVVHNMFLGREVHSGVTLDETDDGEACRGDAEVAVSVRTLRSLRQHVSSLSGGQRQTVAIARAVLWNSKLVILDEPTAALGVAQTEQVLNLVRRLAENGLGVVLITHNMNDVFQVADSIACLFLGQMAAQVRAKDVNNTQVIELITAGRSGDIGLRPAGGRGGGGGMSTSTEQPRLAVRDRDRRRARRGLGDAAGAYWNRIKGGDLGSLPAVLGCVVLVIVFGVMEPDSFLTEQNFANLLNQGAAIMVLAMGLVFVLLLGEIDLSAGFTAGMGAAILGVTLTEHGWAWPLSVLAALATGVAIGFTIALLVARLGIPSFVVSLAFFLGLQGAMLLIIGEGGTIPIRNEAILTVMNKNMSVGAGLAAGA